MTIIFPLNPVPAWGTINSIVRLQAPVACPGIGSLSDRHFILETIHRYCWGYDERREDVIAACLTATAVFSGSVAGNFVVGPYEGRTRILQWLKTLWETQADQRRHCMMNILVDDLSGLSAVVLASLFLTGAENGLARVIATGFYRFQMANEEGVWRIADIYAGLDTGI